MKILQINCVYGHGSTGGITQDIHESLLAQGAESIVCYGRGGRTAAPGVIKVCPEVYGKANSLLSRVRGTMYGGCYLSTCYLTRLIRREKPDVVHLQCINGNFVNIYKLVSWLKERGIKTVLTLHAEFMYTANCGHALECEKWKTGCGSCPRMRTELHSWFWDGTARSFAQMRQAFRGFEKDLTVVSVSPWLRRRAEASPILANMDHRVILNGINTQVFAYRPSGQVRQKHGLTGETIIFHATPMFCDDPAHLKGGCYLLKLAKRMQDRPVRFLVAGKCRVSGEVPENVTLLGEIRDKAQLAEYYSAADLTLLTSRRETFSMVCAESLCCGTPVVGFEAGAPEETALEEYSTFVPFGDLAALEAAVQTWLERGEIPKRQICRAAEQRYSRERMAGEYIELYRGLTHEAPR